MKKIISRTTLPFMMIFSLFVNLFSPFVFLIPVNAAGVPVISVGAYSQCSNDLGTGYTSGDTGCRWINGNLQSNNSAYYEGDATVQRLHLQEVGDGTHTVKIKYGTTKGGKHAYDYVTDDIFSENWITNADFCEGLTGFAGCSALTPNLSPNIPVDPNAGGLDTFARHFKIRNGNITAVGTPVIASGDYSGDSETTILITFNINLATCVNKNNDGTACPVLITWGEHVSKQADWGSGNSAVNISGSPYHVSLSEVDGTSIGSRDNQMQASAIKGSITLDKVTSPSGSNQSFGFTTTGFSSNTTPSLTDAATPVVWNNLSAGAFSITEGATSGWTLTNKGCTGGFSSQITPTASGVSINLTAGENLVCTFTNTFQQGTLTVQKTTIPASDPTVFNISGNGTGSFLNGNTGTVTDATDKVYQVTPGTYSVTETVPSGWVETSNTCTNVVVANGQNATCLITNTKLGTLVIVKDSVPNDPTDFSYTTTGGLSPSTFTLDDDGDNANTFSNTRTYNNLTPGAFTVTEGAFTGFNLTGVNCVDPSSNSTGDTGTKTATINIAAGETVTCTFTNTKKGHILVDKVTNPSGDPQSFNFTAGGTGYSGFSLTDVAAPNDQELEPGTYTLSETVPSGWNQTSATCSDGSLISAISLQAGETITCTFTNTKRGNIIVDKVTLPNASVQFFDFVVTGSGYTNFSLSNASVPNNQSLAPGTYSVSETPVAAWDLVGSTCDDGSPVNAISLQAGETITCTFANTKRGHIIVDKVTVPSGDPQVFDFTAGGSGYTNFNLTDEGAPNNQEVLPGAYTVSEVTVPGWSSDGGVCSNGETPESLDVLPGQTVTCTFTNTKKTHLIVDKVTFPTGDPQSFGFNVTGSGYVGFNLTDQGAVNSQELVPGTYTVSEQGLSGWDLTSATCSNGSLVSAISLQAGETVTCTFTNTKRGHIIVDKVTIPAADPQSFTFNTTGSGYNGFSLTDVGAPNDQEVVPGAYTVSEGVLDSWTSNGGVCDLGETPGSLDVGPGETVHCTFTNTKKGVINIIKDSIPNDPTDFDFLTTGGLVPSSFLLDDDGDNSNALSNTKTYINVLPGAYTVNESSFTGFNLTGINCVDPTDDSVGNVEQMLANINLAAGESVTCTFTNTKRGHIVVDKVTLPGGDPQVFDFSTTGIGYNGFSLADQTTPNDQDLAPGTYSVNEGVLVGWDLTSATCDDGSPITAISLQAGEVVTCTFTNTKWGNIVVDKVTIPSGDTQNFNFTTTGSGYSGFSLADVTTPNSQSVRPGSYTVAEGAVVGWTSDNGNCNSGETPGSLDVNPGETVTCVFTNTKNPFITIVTSETNAVDDQHVFTVTVGQQGSGAFVPVTNGTVVTVNIVPGGFTLVSDNCVNPGTVNGTCTVTINSTAAGIYTVNASASVNIGGHVFNISTNGQGQNSGSAVKTYVDARIVLTPLEAQNSVNDPHTITATVYENPGSGEVLANGELVTFSLVNNTAGAVFVGGVNTCTTNVSGVCSVQINTSTPGNVDTHAVVSVSVGGLTVVRSSDGTHGSSIDANKEYLAGRIIVVKQTLPDGSLDKFDFTSNYGSGFSLGDNESNNSGFLAPGTYSVSENVLSGWDLSNTVCSDESLVSAISLGANEVVTCTFTNTKRGHLIVQKTTIPTNDLTEFNVSASGSGVIYGTVNGVVTDLTDKDYEVTPGTFSVNETVPAGWIKTGDTCQNVVVGAGETKTCLLTNTKLGTITIVKDSIPNDSQDFGFTAVGLDPNNFVLDDDPQDVVKLNSKTYNDVVPGSYSVTEGLTAGFRLTSIVCTDPTSNSNGNVDTRIASIDLGAGENITCTFENTKKAHLIVDKVTLPSEDPQSFSFNVDGTGYVPFSLTDTDNPNNQELDPGTYSVSEVLPSGWVQTSVFCSDESSNDSVNLSAGETVTCTFTNTKNGHLIVEKTTLPGGNPTQFEIDTTGTGNITGGGSGSVSDSTDMDYEVAPGTYSVEENVPDGWDKTGDTCQEVVVGAGETKTCLLTNTKLGKIIIEKQTLPDENTEEFEFTPSYGDNFNLTDNGSNDSGFLTPGAYTVSENVPEGWDLTDISCKSDNENEDRLLLNLVQEVIVNGTSINLDPGEIVTCVFTNTERGHLIVQKTTIPSEDPTVFGISLEHVVKEELANPTALVEGTVTDLLDKNFEVIPGTYSVEENIPEGWVKTGDTCQNVEVGPGETKFCLLTNTKMGSITVVKDAVKNDLQDFTFTSTFGAFTLDDDLNVVGGDNTNLDRKTFSNLMPGTYTFSEDVLSDPLWGLKTVFCVDDQNVAYTDVVSSANGVSVNLTGGKVLTCTFVNSKGEVLAVTGENMNIPLAILAISLSLGLGFVVIKLRGRKEKNI